MTTTIEMGKFVGAPLRSQAFEGISIAENTYTEGQLVSAHAHDAPLLSLVLQGSATEEIGRESRALGAQSLLYTPAYETHGHRYFTAGRWLNIQFSSQWFGRVGAGEAPLPKVSQILRDGAAITWAARLGAELREPDRVSRFAVEGALLLLVADLARLPSVGERRRPRWLQRVEDAIEAAGTDTPSVSELATLAGVHGSHLLRVFRRHHGTTIATYVRRRRIERARVEVAKGDRPLSMIALDAGFADQSHFTRVFRKTFGETPARYARSMRGR